MSFDFITATQFAESLKRCSSEKKNSCDPDSRLHRLKTNCPDMGKTAYTYSITLVIFF